MPGKRAKDITIKDITSRLGSLRVARVAGVIIAPTVQLSKEAIF